mgnify:CR=1 FL=1
MLIMQYVGWLGNRQPKKQKKKTKKQRTIQGLLASRGKVRSTHRFFPKMFPGFFRSYSYQETAEILEQFDLFAGGFCLFYGAPYPVSKPPKKNFQKMVSLFPSPELA